MTVSPYFSLMNLLISSAFIRVLLGLIFVAANAPE